MRRAAMAGVVMPTTVLLLLTITVLALGAISLNSMQTKIATNSADAQIAFQTAEGALNKVQEDVIAGNFQQASFAAGSAGLYFFDPTLPPRWNSIDWSGGGVL
ncbi:MAG: pilus assembly protein PilX, partial [Herminiimonas sp.]|nr:pilus assembly protein PilX [Herminiimonas sp.]